jgi:hypothetical protein
MKLSGLTLLYENKEAILAVAVLSIVFFVFWNKKDDEKNSAPTDNTTKHFKEKWYDVSRMDIIGNKVGVLFLALLALIYFVLFRA